VVERDNIPRLERIYRFKNFAAALAFTNTVGELAEAEAHHPALVTEWGKVSVTWWTHKIRDYIATISSWRPKPISYTQEHRRVANHLTAEGGQRHTHDTQEGTLAGYRSQQLPS
jgi:hypothetical protein